MSIAAETYVKSLTHPKVKGGTRRVLDVIAQLIPEGETTTALIAMKEIATPAGLDRSTVWRLVEVLVGLGLLQVLDRTPGRRACYHLVELTGAPPITTAPLPLVGAAAPRRQRPRRGPADTSPGLFDEEIPSGGEEEAINLLQKITGCLVNLLQKITGSVIQPVAKDHRFGNLLQKITGWTGNLLQKPVAKDHRSLPQGVPITDGLLLLSTKKEEVEASTSSGSYVLPKQEPNQHDVRGFLAWWLKTFPTLRDGAQYTLKAWDSGKAAQLLRGRTLERVQTMCTIAMRMQPGGRDDWLATCPDFGISAVLHKATFLDEEVGRLDREAAQAAAVEAAAAERAALAAKWGVARQDKTQAAADAFDQLSETARSQLEGDAREELKQYRRQMAPDVFEAKVQLLVRSYLTDPRVRERFGVEPPREKFG